MEEGIFTLWSMVHLFAGIALGFMFSVKWMKGIEFAGILAIPFLFFNFSPLIMISLAIIVISIIAYMIEYFSKREKKKLNFKEIIVFALCLLIVWEIVEYFTFPITNFGKESLVNKVSDVVIGFAGFLLTYLFFNKQNKSRKLKKHKK